MKLCIRHIGRLLLVAALSPLLFTGCYDVESDREVCDYNIQLRYHYNEENNSLENMIEYYVATIDEYIFDEAGILFQHRLVPPDPCAEYMHSELTLPPGRYSVIAVGNKDDRSEIWDQIGGGDPMKGVTHRDDMLMTLRNSDVMHGDTRGESEKLYHGYRTFTVKPHGVSRIRVDVINAHLRLRFRVTWKNNTAPPKGEYYAHFESVPSEYALMPELYYPAGSFQCEQHVPEHCDGYKTNCNDVIHHIPLTCRRGSDLALLNELAHRVDTGINADNEMWGEYTTYRIKNETDPVMTIYAADGTQVMRSVDLGGYFDWYGIDLDSELRQDYEISIEIDGNDISIVPHMKVSDWEEGGTLY